MQVPSHQKKTNNFSPYMEKPNTKENDKNSSNIPSHQKKTNNFSPYMEKPNTKENDKNSSNIDKSTPEGKEKSVYFSKNEVEKNLPQQSVTSDLTKEQGVQPLFKLSPNLKTLETPQKDKVDFIAFFENLLASKINRNEIANPYSYETKATGTAGNTVSFHHIISFDEIRKIFREVFTSEKISTEKKIKLISRISSKLLDNHEILKDPKLLEVLEKVTKGNINDFKNLPNGKNELLTILLYFYGIGFVGLAESCRPDVLKAETNFDRFGKYIINNDKHYGYLKTLSGEQGKIHVIDKFTILSKLSTEFSLPTQYNKDDWFRKEFTITGNNNRKKNHFLEVPIKLKEELEDYSKKYSKYLLNQISKNAKIDVATEEAKTYKKNAQKEDGKDNLKDKNFFLNREIEFQKTKKIIEDGFKDRKNDLQNTFFIKIKDFLTAEEEQFKPIDLMRIFLNHLNSKEISNKFSEVVEMLGSSKISIQIEAKIQSVELLEAFPKHLDLTEELFSKHLNSKEISNKFSEVVENLRSGVNKKSISEQAEEMIFQSVEFLEVFSKHLDLTEEEVFLEHWDLKEISNKFFEVLEMLRSIVIIAQSEEESVEFLEVFSKHLDLTEGLFSNYLNLKDIFNEYTGKVKELLRDIKYKENIYSSARKSLIHQLGLHTEIIEGEYNNVNEKLSRHLKMTPKIK